MFFIPTSIGGIVSMALYLLQLLVLLDVVFSYLVMFRVNTRPIQPIIEFVQKIVEPMLEPIRRIIPPQKLGGLDISPLILLILFQMLAQGALQILR